MNQLVRITFLLFTILTLMSVSSVNAQVADTETSAIETLRQADIAWSKAVETQEFDQFYASFLDDARMLAPDVPITEGIASIRELLNGFFGLPGFSLKWQPVIVEVSASGDLGYTIGTHIMTFDDPDGNQVVDHGKYLTIWKKSSDGTWKVSADVFNSNPALPTSEE